MSQPSLRLSSRVAVAALILAATAAATSPSPGWAAERHTERALRIVAVKLGTKATPVRIKVRVAQTAHLRAWVNGRPADNAFRRGARGFRIGELTASNGLRHGVNRIRIRVTGIHGARDVDRRTVRVPRGKPIADAGQNVHTVARRVRVGTKSGGRRAHRGPHKSRWRIISAPRRSKAKLRKPRSKRPTLVRARPGTYVLRHTVVARKRAVSHDTVRIDIRPNDPPVGVSLKTVSGNGIAIGATIYGASSRIPYVVMTRATRTVVESGSASHSTADDAAGADKLRGLAAKYSATTDYMMIVSAPVGVNANAAAGYTELLRAIGGAPLRDDEREAIAKGQPFAFIGLPGQPAGSAWTKIVPVGATVALTSQSLDGYLRFDEAKQKYDLVPLTRPSFDTAVATTADSNTMRFAGANYVGRLPSGATTGLHIVAFDAASMANVVNQVLPLNGTSGSDATRYATAGTDLKAIADRAGNPLVLVQTIGKPTAGLQQWADITAQIARLGGRATLFNELTGSNGYALVGRVGSDLPATEASSATGDVAHLVGIADRTRRWNVEATTAGPPGTVNTELTDVLSQPPTSWPAVNLAAMTYIAKRLGFCVGATSCDLRDLYATRSPATWVSVEASLADLPKDGIAEAGFNPGDYSQARSQLMTEVTAINTISAYVDTLQKTFGTAKSQIDLRALTQAMRNEVLPSGDGQTNVRFLTLLSHITKLGQFAGPPTSFISAGISGFFGLAAYLSTDTGPPILSTKIQTRADGFGEQLARSYDAAARSLEQNQLMLISDWGRMQKASQGIKNSWALPASSQKTLADMEIAGKRSAILALLPIAYPYLIKGTPPNMGPGNTADVTCEQDGGSIHPWRNYPGNAQVRQTERWSVDNIAVRPIYFMTKTPRVFPSQKLANLLFNAPNATVSPGLGLSPLGVLSLNTFGGLVTADQNAPRCNLNGVWGESDWPGPFGATSAVRE
jgi:hypothetical protein